MKEISLNVLERQLKRTTWFPMGMMAFLFITAVSGLLYSEQEQRFRQIRVEFENILSLQQQFVTEEILMGMHAAVRKRFTSILREWQMKYPRVQICMDLKMEGFKLENCSDPKGVKPETSFKPTVVHIDVGVDRLATLKYWVMPIRGIEDYFPVSLLIALFLSILLALLSHNYLVRHLKRKIVKPLLAEIKQNERNETLTEAIQMIAHDVKRPFQILRRAIESIKRAKNKDTMVRFATEVLPNLEKGIGSVEAMVKDVLEIGSDVPLTKSELKPIELINDAIQEIFFVHTHTDIEFTYDLMHEHHIVGDREKLMRVFLNLIENGVNALQSKGRIWINTKEYLKGECQMTQFCIGNNGPPISEEDQKELFKLFFKKSRRGHGLGLAIVKKIITSHGGEIWCESDAEKTEFFLTLPTGKETEHTPVTLPAFSIDITLTEEEKPANKITKLQKIEKTTLSLKIEPNILVFDDDKLIHECWRTKLTKQDVQSHYFWSWEDFLKQKASSLVLNATAFVDIGFKDSDFNGYDIARRLRRLGIRKLYAITGNMESAKKSGLFDDVFGKDVPQNIRGLVA